MYEPTDIKFKAWDVLNKIMRDIEELDWDRDDGTLSGLLVECEGYDMGRTILNEHCTIQCNEPYDEHVILLQYAPINDRKGKRVSEGDILKEHPNGKIGVVTKYMGNFNVEWEGGYPDWSWSEMCADHTPERIEIIGNIFENLKELNGKGIMI